jgi:hypothetical protein
MTCLGHSRLRLDQHHSRATVTAAGGSTFGIKTYGSSSYEANGGAGTYKVDSLTNKPALLRVQAGAGVLNGRWGTLHCAVAAVLASTADSYKMCSWAK